MAAGMHAAGVARRIIQTGVFLDWQRIHIGPDPDPAIATGFSMDQADDAGPGKARVHLVNTPFAQAVGDDGSGSVFLEPDFGVGVKILKDCGQLVRVIGDAG
jgi:hypothetical protein